jgi:hypothetical protein
MRAGYIIEIERLLEYLLRDKEEHAGVDKVSFKFLLPFRLMDGLEILRTGHITRSSGRWRTSIDILAEKSCPSHVMYSSAL